MRVELLCLDVDGTMTDGKLFYGLNLGNLSLGLHSADLANFGEQQTTSLVVSPKFAKNHESQTENPSVVDSAISQNLGENLPIHCHSERSEESQKKNDRDSSVASLSQNDNSNAPKSKLSTQDEFAEILKVFNAKDGLALAYWCKSLNRNAAIITGKKSEILRHRAKELGINFLFMGVKDKGKVLRGLKKDLELDSAQVACVGDDLNDISMFAESSLNFAPHDCASHLKTLPNITILNTQGGKGAVREAIEIILQKEGIYEDFTGFFAR